MKYINYATSHRYRNQGIILKTSASTQIHRFSWTVILLCMVATKIEAINNATVKLEASTTSTTKSYEGKTEYFNCCKTNNTVICKIKFLNENLRITSLKSDDDTLICCQFELVDNSFVAEDCFHNILCKYEFFTGVEKVENYFIPAFAMVSTCADDPEISKQNAYNNFQECHLTNFSVTPIYHNVNNYIRLNISWAETKYKETATIKVESKPGQNRTDCHYSSYELNHDLSVNYLIRPSLNYSSEVEIEPGCVYEALVERNNTDICYTSYSVPDCVGKKCNCHKFTPSPKIIFVDHLSGDDFLVEWSPGTLPNNSHIIERITFQYISPSIESGKIDIYNPSSNVSRINMKLFDGERYTVKGTFYNNYSCSATVEAEFTAPRKWHFYIYIIIVFALTVLIFLLKTVFTNGKKLAKYLRSRYNHISAQYDVQALQPLQSEQIPLTNTNIVYTPMEFSEGLFDQYEFPRNKVHLKEFIARGAFGRVFSAKAMGIGGVEGYKMVAVKTLGEDEYMTRQAENDFIAEIEIFKKIGQHPNIVTLLGCCTLEKPYWMIMEFVPCGDLKNYLMELRTQWLTNKGKQIFFPDIVDDSGGDGSYIEPPSPHTPISNTSSRFPSSSDTVSTGLEDPMTPLLAHYTLDRALDNKELQNFAFQISKGMAHLEQIPITHRDLAARNILINENKTLKISDFGLSRSGPYVNHKSNKLPLRWTAIEAIVNQKYDSRSDVWSFGVVLWEIGTLGAFPYKEIHDSAVLQFLQMGGRLERPGICTDELYSLMQQCWAADPEERPTFRELVDMLDVNKRKIYVNFSQLNPTYVFPPSEIDKCLTPVTVVPLDIGARRKRKEENCTVQRMKECSIKEDDAEKENSEINSQSDVC